MLLGVCATPSHRSAVPNTPLAIQPLIQALHGHGITLAGDALSHEAKEFCQPELLLGSTIRLDS
jgi:hypothetical protein